MQGNAGRRKRKLTGAIAPNNCQRLSLLQRKIDVSECWFITARIEIGQVPEREKVRNYSIRKVRIVARAVRILRHLLDCYAHPSIRLRLIHNGLLFLGLHTWFEFHGRAKSRHHENCLECHPDLTDEELDARNHGVDRIAVNGYRTKGSGSRKYDERELENAV